MALEKVSSYFVKSEFHKNSRQFQQDLQRNFLSAGAAQSLIGQGLICFCPETIISGDEYSAFYLFGQLLDGLSEKGWIKESLIVPSKVEFQSFMREQRQLKEHSTRKSRDVGHTLSSCVSQSRFRSRFRMNIIRKIASLCGKSGFQVQCI